jgi:hypothetical protein
MDVNQLRQGLMMLNNEKIVRELYAAAEGSGKDIAKLVSFFSDEGYMCDIPSGIEVARTGYWRRYRRLRKGIS